MTTLLIVLLISTVVLIIRLISVRRRADRLIVRYITLSKRMLADIKRRHKERKTLRKASSLMLSMFIKEIKVLTPAKLKAIRRMRNLLHR